MGSTGSIGTQALDVVRAEPERFRVVARSAPAARSTVLVAQAARVPSRAVVVIADPARCASCARPACPPGTEVLAGAEGSAVAAQAPTSCVNGVVGFAGLPVTLAALEAGQRLALANKESLIAAGPVVQRLRRTPGAEIVPVDSEHCAVHQCLRVGAGHDGRRPHRAHRRGGPFRAGRPSELGAVTVDDALAHPDLVDGARRSRSTRSTLMNKGLEVIEAHELFGVDYDRIDVVVHPQSIVHSMVEFTDGATIAQLVAARHAPADRLRPGLSRPRSRRLRRASTGPSRGRSTSSRPTARSSPASTWPTRPAGPAARRRPG